MRSKVTIETLINKKENNQKITMLTAYDYPLALLEEKAGIDIILVGDSLGMTVLGYDSTLPVDMETMITHAKAVRRGAGSAFLVGDMPYMSYQISKEEAIRNAGRYMAEVKCDCVKLEGGANMADTVQALVNATIPVMGHLGLTPQSIAQLGGFKSQGRDSATALKIISDAQILEEAGISLLLLEAVPPEVAKIIADRAEIPVISIGAGPYCHGQLVIVHDMLGFFEAFTPKFVKKYADLNETILNALCTYKQEVESGEFPSEEYCYKMKDNSEIEKILRNLPEK